MAKIKQYPAKLLLFGEHLLLKGATALALPVPAFHAQWVLKSPGSRPALWEHLKEISAQMRAVDWLDSDRLQTDISVGWYLDSNIPQGYGMGSSGALCAALYDQYSRSKSSDYVQIKTDLAALESCFHGQSSGIDPLTTYLNHPLLIKGGSEVSLAQQAEWPAGQKPDIFLIDTRQGRKTAPLVQWFLAQSEKAAFASLLRHKILPTHEKMVQAWLFADMAAFWPALQRISQLQAEYFSPMLPADTQLMDLWWEFLHEKHSFLKICGAGGGGFLLGFTTRPNLIKTRMAEQNIPVIFPYQPR